MIHLRRLRSGAFVIVAVGLGILGMNWLGSNRLPREVELLLGAALFAGFALGLAYLIGYLIEKWDEPIEEPGWGEWP